MSPLRFQRFATGALVYTLAVILWGAFVRVTGSGAGCGSHWPTCHGQVIPRAPSTETLIELTHRVTSSVAGLLAIALFVLARRTFQKGHFARAMAGASLILMITEGLVGAGLVLFEKVAHDQSLGRGVWMAAHLINTFLLVAAMTLCAWAATSTRRPRWSLRERVGRLSLGSLALLLLTGVTGAIAALGDTLFPAETLAHGLAADFAPGSHLFVKLRAVHPFVAVLSAVVVLMAASTLARDKDERIRAAAQRSGTLVVVQVLFGLVNLLLAAPAIMQLGHLLLADLLWMSAVVLAANALSGAPSPVVAGSPGPAEPSPG